MTVTLSECQGYTIDGSGGPVGLMCELSCGRYGPKVVLDPRREDHTVAPLRPLLTSIPLILPTNRTPTPLDVLDQQQGSKTRN
jgi:hypothetical protein